MSKPLALFSFAVLLILSGPTYPQQSSAVLRITPGTTSSATVTLDTPPRRQLSFATSIANAGDLGKKITNIHLSEPGFGQPVAFRELQPGEYLADNDFTRVSYTVSLVPSRNRAAAAHASWMAYDTGVLMLADLLPLHADKSVTISFAGDMPIWSVHTKGEARSFTVSDAENETFYVGSGWRVRATNRCGDCPLLFISGSWHFTDEEATNFISDIIERYDKQFRSTLTFTRVGVAITKYPVPTEPGSWDAETRGRSVTIISSDTPFRTQSLQRLHEQLRHEVFHLWIPNNVNLTGNYDWFYEGFALYQSLKLAVELNRIRFEDFLDTLSRAHTIDSAYTQRPSLIDASRNRFSGTNTQVYARGMLVAFLTDLALMEHSKSSVEELLRTLYQKHRKPATAVDGNDAVIGLMKANPSVEPIVRNYIEGKATIDWKPELNAAGIEDADPGPLTTLRVLEKPSKRQKTLLDKLGYNNWRKLSPDSK